MEIDKKNVETTTDTKEATNEESIPKKILHKAVLIISFILAYLLARGCTHAVVSGFNTSKYSKEDYQVSKDAGFVKGFEVVNTTALQDYCSPSGYIPNEYIHKFRTQFSKTIQNANNTLEKYATKEQIQKEMIDKVYQTSLGVLESEYQSLNAQYKVSRKEYCQFFDVEAGAILADKLQTFKQQRPNAYLD